MESVELEEPPASFKSAVWEHFGFPVQYNGDGMRASMRPNAVVEEPSYLLKVLETCYSVPSRAHISQSVVPANLLFKINEEKLVFYM